MGNKKLKINNFEFILSDDVGILILILLGLFGLVSGILKSAILPILIGLVFILAGTGILFYIAKPRNCEKCHTIQLERIPTEISFKEGVEKSNIYRKNIQYKCPKCGFIKILGLRRVA